MSGKVISGFEPLGFGDGRLIQKLRFFSFFFNLFFISYLSTSFQLLAKPASMVLHQKKED